MDLPQSHQLAPARRLTQTTFVAFATGYCPRACWPGISCEVAVRGPIELDGLAIASSQDSIRPKCSSKIALQRPLLHRRRGCHPPAFGPRQRTLPYMLANATRPGATPVKPFHTVAAFDTHMDQHRFSPLLSNSTCHISPSCSSPGATQDLKSSEVPVLDESYCADKRHRAPDRVFATLTPVSKVSLPRDSKVGQLPDPIHLHATD